MAASTARLLAAAKHLLRMQAFRQREIDKGAPPHMRLTASELVAQTSDPADTIIAGFLLNREFMCENPELPESIVDRAIAKARNGATPC